jgi:uncharacterized protein
MSILPFQSNLNSKIFKAKIEEGPLLGQEITLASNWRSRLKGLLGTKKLPPGKGMLIVPCQSIHMFFMSIPLDIIFLDKTGIVVGIIHKIKPWRISRYYSQAYGVLEMPAGTCKKANLEKGDLIVFEESPKNQQE